MRFGLLGMLEVFDGERRVTLSAPKVRSVLALLLLHSGRVVHTASLIDELWGENPPLTALTTLHTYIYQLRKAIPVRRTTDAGPGKPAPTGTPQPQWLRTAYAGYVADIPPESIDLRQFESLAVQGKQALDRGVMAEAAKPAAGRTVLLARPVRRRRPARQGAQRLRHQAGRGVAARGGAGHRGRDGARPAP